MIPVHPPPLRVDSDGWTTLACVPSVRRGRWHVLPAPPRPIDQRDVPARMPRLHLLRPYAHRRKRAAPTLAEREPARVELIATLVDLCGLPKYRVARLLDGEGDEPSERMRKHVNRRLSAGRARLAELDVLPWAIFDSGRLPPDWIGTPEVNEALQLWRLQTSLFSLDRA